MGLEAAIGRVFEVRRSINEALFDLRGRSAAQPDADLSLMIQRLETDSAATQGAEGGSKRVEVAPALV